MERLQFELRSVVERVGYEINERNHKNVQLRMRKHSKNEMEYRGSKQAFSLDAEREPVPAARRWLPALMSPCW